MRKPLRLLIIEDCEDDAELVRRMLRSAGYELQMSRVATPEAVSEALDREPWDLIVADHALPGFGAPEALALVKDRGLDVPFIIVSGTISEERAVTAMRAGASDFIQKDRMARLPSAVERELEQARVRRASRELEAKQREAERELARMASHDQITGLKNRGVFVAAIEEVVSRARQDGTSLAVLHVCLDGFEGINTMLGHAVGDQVLSATARRLEQVITGPDRLASLGGRHFGVMLPGGDSTRAHAVSRAIADALEHAVTAGEISVQLEPSIGIAMYPGHGDKASDLLRCASVAREDAQRTGFGPVVYSSQQNKLDPEALVILGGLREGISNDQLYLEFQPIVDLRDERTVGVEALVRWDHPELGLIGPGRFVPLAESSGLIRPLSHWVLARSMAHWREWQSKGVDLRIAVNLSARNLSHPDLPGELRGLMDKWEIAQGALEIEITESALMTDPERALGVLQQLHDWHISLAIDDFGTGYSSFAYLRSLPVDKIKIDRSFVKILARTRRDTAILQAMIDLGQTLGMKVLAEGVEDEVTYDLLATLGCDMAQGYFVGRPMGSDAILQWLSSSRWGKRSADPYGFAAPLPSTIRDAAPTDEGPGSVTGVLGTAGPGSHAAKDQPRST